MAQLPNYVDLKDYCLELASITNLDISEVEKIVLSAFAFIQAGAVSATRGFVFIEKELNKQMEEKKAKTLAFGMYA